MNEVMLIYLNMDENEARDCEEFIQRIDDLLLNFGIKYSGLWNAYVPIDHNNRDSVLYNGIHALKNTVWLKDKLAYTPIMHISNACALNKILTDRMTAPSKAKMAYYEEYYKKTRQLAHDILVDEENQLCDGYISYLLAKKYGLDPAVYRVVKYQSFRKLVCGRHVRLEDGEWRIKSDKCYKWIYTLNKPVVPGDILRVETQRGLAYIQVDHITYVAGKEFCNEYRKVRQHVQSYQSHDR